MAVSYSIRAVTAHEDNMSNPKARPTFTPDAITLACTLIAQAQGDTAKARRAASAAVAWLQQPDVDPTFKPDVPPASVPQAAAAGQDRDLAAELDEARQHILQTVQKLDEVTKARRDLLSRFDGQARTIKALEAATAEAESRCGSASDNAMMMTDALTQLIRSVAKWTRIPCENVVQAEDALQAFAGQVDALQVQLAIAADAALSCPACGAPSDGGLCDDCSAHAGDDSQVLAEAVERGATVLSVTTAEDVVISAEPPVPVAPVAPAPQPAPAAPDEEWPQFAHLPEKMRAWAIDRAIAARG
jgi:hypothetical protein